MFDTHVHLNDAKLYGDLDLHIKEAKDSGVNRIAFNENFIIDLLDSIDNDTVILNMPKSEIKPMIATNKDDTFLVLPVKLK